MDLLVHGVLGSRYWLVQPESTMARVLGTKVWGAVLFATFSFYLVPSRSQMGLFLAEPPFCISFCCALFMPSYRFFAVSAGMSRGITMSPSVVPISGVGWLCAGIFVEFGNDGSEFGNILECLD